MKTLQESLFDDNVKKDLKIKDVFVPVEVVGANLYAKQITNMFVLNKLKAVAPYRADVSDLPGCEQLRWIREPIEYIIAIINEFPLTIEAKKEAVIGFSLYDKQLIDIFGPTVRNGLYNRTFWIEIRRYDSQLQVHLIRSSMSGRAAVKIIYDMK